VNRLRHVAVVKHLIRDTFQQARASGISWLMLALTAICVLICLSVSVSGDVPLQAGDEPDYFLPSHSGLAANRATPVNRQPAPVRSAAPDEALRDGVKTIKGQMTLAFGAVSVPVSRDRRGAVHFLELSFAGGLAGTLGLLLALVWTAGFVPSFLEPGAASVLLAKPVERGHLLLGKYLGVLVFVASQVVLFALSTWLALGVRTRIWDMGYLWCIPLLLLQFAIFYSFSVLVGVMTRGTAACIFGAVLFWLLAWGINYARVTVRAVPDARSVSAPAIVLADAAYWISPKPIDAGLMLFNALGAEQDFEKPRVFQLLESSSGFSSGQSVLSSLVITAALLALSIHEFKATDY
jgi:ABC-type transport system involved in multi-copper enzyme maturation permease subunit